MDKSQLNIIIKEELINVIKEGSGASYKIALDLVGRNAREKVFKRHKVGKYDADLSYDIIQDAIDILKKLL